MKFDKFAIIPAAATMFNEDECVDEAAQRKLIRFLLEKKVDGFYIGGSTGEGFMMDKEERKRLISICVDEIAGRVPVICYTGSNDTKNAVEISKFAEKAGADAISSVRPYYGGFDIKMVKDYYKVLSECVDIPLLIYNNSGAQLSGLEEIVDICSLPNCIGVKYTMPNHYEMRLIKSALGNKLVFSGADEMLASAMVTGVDGAIGSSYNFIPETAQNLRRAYEESNMDEFSRWNEIQAHMIGVFLNHYFLSGMKAVLEMMGIGHRFMRSPNFVMNDSQFEALKKDLSELKIRFDIKDVALFDMI